jgi:acyl-CoA thioesterase-2
MTQAEMRAEPRAPSQALESLLHLLDLEQLELNLFRGVSPEDGRTRIFGGQVLAQGMVAAMRTVDPERRAHSLHAYFLRPGDPRVPIVFDVHRIRDGKSFTTRRVVAVQRGEAIFNMAVSFQRPEEGLAHQIDMPDVAGPENSPLYEDTLRAAAERRGGELGRDRRVEFPVEVRTVGGFHAFDESPRPPQIHTWIRTKGPMPDDPGLHQCVLAYASDLTIMVAAVYPHRASMTSPGFQSASLDHAMWFHRPFRIDDWVLHQQHSPASGGARGLGLGTIYTRGGALVASCAQEGLIRLGPTS